MQEGFILCQIVFASSSIKNYSHLFLAASIIASTSVQLQYLNPFCYCFVIHRKIKISNILNDSLVSDVYFFIMKSSSSLPQYIYFSRGWNVGQGTDLDLCLSNMLSLAHLHESKIKNRLFCVCTNNRVVIRIVCIISNLET